MNSFIKKRACEFSHFVYLRQKIKIKLTMKEWGLNVHFCIFTQKMMECGNGRWERIKQGELFNIHFI
jgi:hypothetical protein